MRCHLRERALVGRRSKQPAQRRDTIVARRYGQGCGLSLVGRCYQLGLLWEGPAMKRSIRLEAIGDLVRVEVVVAELELHDNQRRTQRLR